MRYVFYREDRTGKEDEFPEGKLELVFGDNTKNIINRMTSTNAEIIVKDGNKYWAEER